MDFAKYNLTPPTLSNGDVLRDMQVDSAGRLLVASGAGTSANQVQGTSASGVADDGSNPVKVGGLVTTGVPPIRSTGQRVDAWFGAVGQLIVGGYNDKTLATATFAVRGDNTDGETSDTSGRLIVGSRGYVFNNTTWDRLRGDLAGMWTHAPPSTVNSALSGTIAASGGTAAIVMTNTTKTEIINPSTATLWASWGTPAVNGAGSFQIVAGGQYFVPDRAAGTLTLLSTAATQPYTVNRFS